MATTTELEISARSLDFGARVVAVGHVTSVAFARRRPLASTGLALIALAAAGIGYDLLLGKGIAAIRSGGSTAMWLALILLGVGVFCLVFQRREITIKVADGSRIRLPAGRDDFARAVVARIAEAIRADRDSPIHYRINFGTETVQILNAQDQTARGTSPADQRAPRRAETPPAGLPINGAPALNGTGHGDWALPPGGQHPPVNGARGPANGTDGGEPLAGTPSWPGPIANADGMRGSGPSTLPPFPPLTSPPGPGGLGAHPFGPVATGARHALAQPATQPPNPKRELDALIALVVRSNIQHKGALLELLEVVDDHLKGGQTDRADAVAHWQSFASYVDQYLGGVEGLAPMAKRFGRNFA